MQNPFHSTIYPEDNYEEKERKLTSSNKYQPFQE